MKPRCLALFLAVLGTGAPPAFAQAHPAPPPLRLPSGVRVRVWTHSLPGQRIEGTLLRADSGAVTLVPRSDQPLVGGELKLPAADVTRLDVTLGKKRHWWQGAVIGAALGLAVALTDDVDPVLCKVNENVLCSRGEALLVYGLTSTAIGAGVGALIKTDRWTPVALDALGPPVREARGPLSVKLTFRF
ncbi:MAG TPA: hypothetical protein VLL75_17815 [Vicinamibacteria bacterium]|nr:hypothetical protein [Vicinamibacteria bacterium]